MTAVIDMMRPANDITAPPANLDAEQALLGILLYDNAALERMGDNLKAVHFYEPFHARLYDTIEGHVRRGQLAEPMLLAEQFSRDPAFAELGGVSYLADLVDRAPSAANAYDYARVIFDLARRRELIRIGGDLIDTATRPRNDETSQDMLEGAEQALYSLGETGVTSQGLQASDDYITGAVNMAAAAFSRDGGLSGLSTGLIDLDQKLGGLHPSDLLILAARPSMGKSALAVNIALHAARRYAFEVMPDGSHKTTSGGRVAFFSLEMSAEQLGLRMLAEMSGVSGDRLRKGEIDAGDFNRVRDAAYEMQGMPLYVDATGGITLAKMAARARRMKRQGGLDLIVVDYLQLMSAGVRTEGRVQEITMISMGLKTLAKELSVPVIALSQLSRQVEQREDKRPMLSDLRESGSIEQDADCVMFIYREEYYLGRSEPKAGTPEHLDWSEKMDQARGLAEVIIGKQRHGPIGTVRMAFNEDLTKFSNLARDPSRFEGSPRLPHGADA